MNAQMVRRALLATAVILAVPGTAVAAPPNDSAAGAGVFTPYSAPNGVPTQQEALADLAERDRRRRRAALPGRRLVRAHGLVPGAGVGRRAG